MLNKELLMLGDQRAVYVTLRFFGGRNSGTKYMWLSPDGTKQTRSVFDERVDIVETLTCKPNTSVYISTGNYSGNLTVTPPQTVSTVIGPTTYLSFTAFRDVTVDF